MEKLHVHIEIPRKSVKVKNMFPTWYDYKRWAFIEDKKHVTMRVVDSGITYVSY